MASQVVQYILRLGSTVVLARILSPADFGLVAMATAVTGFIEMFKDLGLSTATIQKDEINNSQVSNLFWINLGVSAGLALILSAMAPAIALFYGEPSLTWIVVSLAGTLVLSGLTVQHVSLLRRQMRFTAVGVIQVAAMTLSVFCGVAMALVGWRYWALVGMTVMLQFATAILAWAVCKWRPILPRRNVGMYSLLRFGGHITGFNLINYFARNMDNVLLGRMWGADALGLYSRAYGIMMLPISQIRRPLEIVATPALSRIQGEPERYRRYYAEMVRGLAFITMPIMAVLLILAHEVIYVVLGSQWLGAVPIFQVLCVNALIQPVASTWGMVMISMGLSYRFMRWGAISSGITVLSFFVGLPWGGFGMAISYTITTYLLVIPTILYCFRGTPVSLGTFLSSIRLPLFATLVMSIAMALVQGALLLVPEGISIACSLLVGGVSYLLTMRLLPGGRELLHSMWSHFRLLTKRS